VKWQILKSDVDDYSLIYSDLERHRFFHDPFFLKSVAKTVHFHHEKIDSPIVVPIQQKWGILYSAQPHFAQYIRVPQPDLFPSFMEKLTQKVKLIDLAVDQKIPFPDVHYRERTNYILNLNRPYSEIQKAYKKDLKKNLRKQSDEVSFRNDWTDAPFDLHQKIYGKLSGLRENDYRSLKHIATKLKEQDLAFQIHAFYQEEIIASALFIKSAKRIHYVMGAPTETGRSFNATFKLLDHVIQENSGHDLILDFEGSDLPNVSSAYQKFNPVKETYYQMQWVHPILRWWKRPPF
jgi:hypothetical protein